MWHHGTRALHIPILILSGCLFIFVFALFLRFWYLNIRSKNYKSTPAPVLKSVNVVDPEMIYIKCPKCNSLMGVIAPEDEFEFPCVNCGTMGSISIYTAQPLATYG